MRRKNVDRGEQPERASGISDNYLKNVARSFACSRSHAGFMQMQGAYLADATREEGFVLA